MSLPAPRRRVDDARAQDVAAVIASVIRPHELDSWGVGWLDGADRPAASHLQDGGTDESEPALWIEVSTDDEDWWYGAWQPATDWPVFLAAFGDRLSEWVSETSFGWGEWRPSTTPDRMSGPPGPEAGPGS